MFQLAFVEFTSKPDLAWAEREKTGSAMDDGGTIMLLDVSVCLSKFRELKVAQMFVMGWAAIIGVVGSSFLMMLSHDSTSIITSHLSATVMTNCHHMLDNISQQWSVDYCYYISQNTFTAG